MKDNSDKPQRIAIKLSKGGERALRERHPWIFADSIIKQSKPGKSGDIAIIYSFQKNKLIGVGLLDLDSTIRIKVLLFFETQNIDYQYFKNKLNAAFHLRKHKINDQNNAYRLVYGENDGLPSLIIDVYNHVAVIKLYSTMWFPYLEMIKNALIECINPDTIILRMSRNVLKVRGNIVDGSILYGNLINEEVTFKENGLVFKANPIKGHKTGYFLDHRENRIRVGEYASGKRVLDIFSYAGGFSVHALAGGADKVVSMDISNQAQQMAVNNVALNGLSGNHSIIVGDAFVEIEKLKKKNIQFDLVIIDPPSMAKRSSEVDRAKKKYIELLKMGLAILNPGGILVYASCSSRIEKDTFFDIIETELKQKVHFEILEKRGHAYDHPEGIPELNYLKCGYYKINSFK